MGNNNETMVDTYTLDDNIVFAENLRILECNSFVRLNHTIFMLCIHGSIQVDINNCQYTVEKNDLLICSPGFIIGHYVASPDFDCKMLCILPEEITQLLLHSESDSWNKFYYVKNHPVLHIDDHSVKLCEMYYEILRLKCKDSGNTYFKKIARLLIRAVLYEVLNLIDKLYDSPNYVAPHLSQADVLFRRFYDLLCENHIKERKVSFYADKLCITAKYLSTVCKRVTGKTVSHWIDEMVMAEIKTLLLHSNKSIKEICHECDFASMSFFGKYVKAHVGVSPNEYRRLHASHK